MTSAPRWIPSKRMQAAANSERRRIEREIEKAEKREARHRQEMEQAQQKRAELAEELTAIMRFADENFSPNGGPQLRVISSEGQGSNELVLKGAQIREFAVKLVVGSRYAEEGIHYKTWFDLVASQGVKLTGKDPVATFLTQISRSPVVQKSERPGIYLIDSSFPEKAREQIRELNAILDASGVPEPEASIEEIDTRRVAERQAKNQIRALERAVQEADRSLNAQESGLRSKEAFG